MTVFAKIIQKITKYGNREMRLLTSPLLKIFKCQNK